jgi:predicted HTH domain antitoxin
MTTLTIEYPPELLEALDQSQEAFNQEARLLLAVKLYEIGRLTTGLAAQLAGIPRSEFFLVLGHYQLSPIPTQPEELAADLAHALEASHPQ